jgi:hypothetical protein
MTNAALAHEPERRAAALLATGAERVCAEIAIVIDPNPLQPGWVEGSHIEPAMLTARKRPSLCPGRRPAQISNVKPAGDRLPASQFIQFGMLKERAEELSNRFD